MAGWRCRRRAFPGWTCSRWGCKAKAGFGRSSPTIVCRAGGDGDIPDPYGGSAADFDHVLDLLSAAAPVIVERLGRLLGADDPGAGW